ncbi:MAG: heparan-alpha-glucosaminide N-acetyltransferase domain-containing protein, partial [Bacteroidota bacterium]
MIDTSKDDRRIRSIDFFRGVTMFLLVGEFSGLFHLMVEPPFKGTVIDWIFTQFHHHLWNGLRFWDLVQPFFMFIVGVSLALSVSKRLERGDDRSQITRHVV